ncbi:MAG: HNH endonuclease [Blastomonas fulva]|uniref:HNH endonuclease n=1 Tax=Blastomonas fulva TaxID=1550728 RepID=UPI0040333B4B
MTKPLPSPRQLRAMLDFNPDTGIAIWRWRSDLRVSCNNRIAGKPAFNCLDSRGYYRGQIAGKQILFHRVAWAIHFGKWPTGQIDHINGDRRDNRIANLRDVPRAENMRNKGRSRKNTSGTTGVYWHSHRQKWAAEIRVEGKNKHLGYFAKIEDAVAARKVGSQSYGFHKNHGSDRISGRPARLVEPARFIPVSQTPSGRIEGKSGEASPIVSPGHQIASGGFISDPQAVRPRQETHGHQMRAASTPRSPSGSCPTPAPLGHPSR